MLLVVAVAIGVLIHTAIVLVCPGINHAYKWLWWKIKNGGLVTFRLEHSYEDRVAINLGYCSNLHIMTLMDFRDRLYTEHDIIIYYANGDKYNNDKVLVFKSPAQRTMFLMRYI